MPWDSAERRKENQKKPTQNLPDQKSIDEWNKRPSLQSAEGIFNRSLKIYLTNYTNQVFYLISGLHIMTVDQTMRPERRHGGDTDELRNPDEYDSSH